MRRAGFEGEGLELGEALFDAILDGRSGVIFTVDDYDETWRRLAHPDGRVHLAIPELLEELAGAARTSRPRAADRRRSRSCCRPASAARRRPTPSSATRLAQEGPRRRPAHAPRRRRRASASADGGRVRVTTKRGSVDGDRRDHRHAAAGPRQPAQRPRPVLPRRRRRPVVHGVAPNELTSTDDRDWLAGTPHHKHVRARVEALVPMRRRTDSAEPMDPEDWIAAFAAALGVEAPDAATVETLLELAGVGRPRLGTHRRAHRLLPGGPGRPRRRRAPWSRPKGVTLTVRRTRFDEWPCPIARTTDLIGDWWTPLVLRDAFAGCRRFEQFQESLGIPRAVLAARLDRLVAEGLMDKRLYEEHPPRYEYRLTAKGLAFWDVLAAMWRWGEDWLWADGDEPPLMLADRDTGDEVRPVVVDEHTGERLDVRAVRIRSRRGATTPV